MKNRYIITMIKQIDFDPIEVLVEIFRKQNPDQETLIHVFCQCSQNVIYIQVIHRGVGSSVKVFRLKTINKVIYDDRK